jgi:hypothetical protein
MSEWALAISVLAAAVGVGVLIQRVMAQVVGIIDSRFDDAEKRRREAMELWQERLLVRDHTIDRIVDQLKAAVDEHREFRDEHREFRDSVATMNTALAEHRRSIAEQYVSRETWLEEAGSVRIKLEKIYERLQQLDPKHG